MRHPYQKIIFIWLLSFNICAHAGTAEPLKTNITIAIILSDSNDEYISVFNSIENFLLTEENHKLNLINYSQSSYEKNTKNINYSHDIVVTIGTAAAAMYEKLNEHTPVISVFLPKENFNNIWGESDKIVTGIIIDQPIERYIQLLSIILKQGDNVGVLSSNNKNHIKTLTTQLKNVGLNLKKEIINGNVTAKNISDLLKKSDLILVLPYPKIISPQRSKWLLYMAYKESKPVVAYSSSFSNAGALAAIYTSPKSIGLQTGKFIEKIIKSSEPEFISINNFKRINYPEYFTIQINNNISMHLFPDLPDSMEIKKKIILNINSSNSNDH